jgi:hypothetical protein
MALREYRTNRTCRECGITRFWGGDIDLISVYDLKDINQNFCQWSGETWWGGSQTFVERIRGGSLLSGFIIQLRDWEEWLVNNRLRTVGGVGLYRNRKRTLHSFLVNQTFVIPVASKTFLNLIRNEPIKSWNIANKFLINNATPYFNMQRAILLFPGFPHP